MNDRLLKVNQSRSRFGKIYNLVFLIVKIQKNGGKFEFILLKTLGCKFFQNGTSNNLALNTISTLLDRRLSTTEARKITKKNSAGRPRNYHDKKAPLARTASCG